MQSLQGLQPDLMLKIYAAKLKESCFEAVRGVQVSKPLMQALGGLQGIKGWEVPWTVHGLVSMVFRRVLSHACKKHHANTNGTYLSDKRMN